MRSLVLIALAFVVLLGLAPSSQAQDRPDKPKIENARPYIEQWCAHLSSTNPRVRFAAREALGTFGAQAVPLIQAKLRAFLDVKQTEYVKRLMLQLRSGGKFQVPVHLRAWQRDLEERWKNRGNLTEAEVEALKEEWGEFKRQAAGKGGAGGGK